MVQTNSGKITSLSTWGGTCAVGSEDTFLRTWPLNFEEYEIEAQHEGVVSCVAFSGDGELLVCGTMYGAVGVMNTETKDYKILLRAHTGPLMSMDFNRSKDCLVTVSEDHTIRLWSSTEFDQVS